MVNGFLDLMETVWRAVWQAWPWTLLLPALLPLGLIYNALIMMLLLLAVAVLLLLHIWSVIEITIQCSYAFSGEDSE